MGFIVPRRSFCGSGAFLQNRPRSSLDYKIGWFRKWVILQAGNKWKVGVFLFLFIDEFLLCAALRWTRWDENALKRHIRSRTSPKMRHLTRVYQSVTFEFGQVCRCNMRRWKGVFSKDRSRFPTNAHFFENFKKKIKKMSKKFKKKFKKNLKKYFSIFLIFFWKIQKMYAWEMTKNQRSGLSDKATRFQKWPQDGNISGYADFLSSRENRRFYTKCSFIFWILLFFVEKYKAFFVISREGKK